MTDPFAKVSVGDPVKFSAQAWNAMLEAGKAFQQKGGFGASGTSQLRNSTIIRVRNDTGSSLPRNAVVGLHGPVFSPVDSEDAFLREVAFSVVTPDIAKHKRRYAVLLEPSPNDVGAYYGDSYGRITRAFLAGVCAAKVNITDEAHTSCDITNGSTDHFTSGGNGDARILWAEWEDTLSGYSTGVQWCILMLGASGSGGVARGVVTTPIPTGGISSPSNTGRVTLYTWDGSTSAAGQTGVPVLNDMTIASSVPNGTVVKLAEIDAAFWLVSSECY